MRRECRERFPRHLRSAIPACITARAPRTSRDACRDRYLVVSFGVGGGNNVPGIPGACATRNFAYLVKGPCTVVREVHRIPVYSRHKGTLVQNFDCFISAIVAKLVN